MAINTLTKVRYRGQSSRQTVALDTSGREVLTVDGTSHRSSAINAQYITMWSGVDFRINIGDDTVTADANAPLLPANTLITIDWVPGEYIASFYDGSNTGSLYIVGAY